MKPENNKISALLITYNEEDNITEVLECLCFADEIIIVDSYSTDNTVNLIKKFPKVKLTQRKFKNFTDQKQFTLDLATHNWILFIDADERIDSVLREEIISITSSNGPTASAYYFLRTFMFKDKVLRYSGWQTDKNYRLFKKDKVCFDQNKIVHETLLVDGPSLTLSNRLIHNSYKNYEDYRQKMIKYGQMRAKEELKQGKKPYWPSRIMRPLWKFFHHYIIRLGFLDGKKGIIICYLNTLGVAARYKELAKLHKNKNPNAPIV